MGTPLIGVRIRLIDCRKVVECYLNCRIEKAGDQERIEFSFVGQDEGDEVSVRGWALLEGDMVRGRIYFHHGDESGFLAERS